MASVDTIHILPFYLVIEILNKISIGLKRFNQVKAFLKRFRVICKNWNEYVIRGLGFIDINITINDSLGQVERLSRYLKYGVESFNITTILQDWGIVVPDSLRNRITQVVSYSTDRDEFNNVSKLPNIEKVIVHVNLTHVLDLSNIKNLELKNAIVQTNEVFQLQGIINLNIFNLFPDTLNSLPFNSSMKVISVRSNLNFNYNQLLTLFTNLKVLESITLVDINIRDGNQTNNYDNLINHLSQGKDKLSKLKSIKLTTNAKSTFSTIHILLDIYKDSLEELFINFPNNNSKNHNFLLENHQFNRLIECSLNLNLISLLQSKNLDLFTNLKKVTFYIGKDLEFFNDLIALVGLNSSKIKDVTLHFEDGCSNETITGLFLSNLRLNSQIESLSLFKLNIYMDNSIYEFIKSNHPSLKQLSLYSFQNFSLELLSSALSVNTSIIELKILDISQKIHYNPFETCFKILSSNPRISKLIIPTFSNTNIPDTLTNLEILLKSNPNINTLRLPKLAYPTLDDYFINYDL